MVKVLTYGCRLNSYESEVIQQSVKDVALENTVVINSCAVTNQVELEIKQHIRKIHKNDPSKAIVVVGCASQLSPKDYLALPGVVKVIGNGAKLHRHNYLSDARIILEDNVQEDVHQHITNFPSLSRGLVQIQTGCNHSCTFCATTIARGQSRSRPTAEIVNQIEKFAANGYNEIILTGVDISDYGKDIGTSLAALIAEILEKVPELPRLRLSSVDIAEIDIAMQRLLIEEKRVMPHLHLSIQSGNALILKRMKRRHNPEQIVKFCSELRLGRPEIVFGADIIAGFPTETDAMFDDTVKTIMSAGITYLHVFSFSPKQNTPAAKMPQVPLEVRKRRASHLRHIGSQLVETFLHKQIGKEMSVIVESNDTGRAENFALVKCNFMESGFSAKQLAKVKVIASRLEALVGQICQT